MPYNPELNGWFEPTKFRFWCQKVLPLVYDDSLSYYELLCKVVDYLNKYGEDLKLLGDDYVQLVDYVNNYFEEDMPSKIRNFVYQWLDLHPEATTTVQDGSLTPVKFMGSSMPFVMPEMYGEAGEGNSTVDTTCFAQALASGYPVALRRRTYYLTQRLTVNNIVYGNGATLDFSQSADEHGVYSESNYTRLYDLNIENVSNGYGLYLIYPANYSCFDTIFVNNCANGVYISRMWYSSVNNIRVRLNNETGVCLRITSNSNTQPANCINFKDIYLTGGSIGLLFDSEDANPVTSNSISFNGISCSRHINYGVYFASTFRGNVCLRDFYSEDCALSANYTGKVIYLPDSESKYVMLENGLIRGAYEHSNDLISPDVFLLGKHPIYEAYSNSTRGGITLDKEISNIADDRIARVNINAKKVNISLNENGAVEMPYPTGYGRSSLCIFGACLTSLNPYVFLNPTIQMYSSSMILSFGSEYASASGHIYIARIATT